MTQLSIRPSDKFIANYYDVLNQYGQLHMDHEGAVRNAFQQVLNACAKKVLWTFVPEWPIKTRTTTLRVDGALIDEFKLPRGMWEAKDEKDSLEKEVRKKLNLGYPGRNILFQSPSNAILVQHGQIARIEDITSRDTLVDLLKNLFEFRDRQILDWEEAVARFKEEVPEQSRALKELIDREHKKNSAFREAFAAFVETCRASLNPQITDEAVERMLIQHILTERIFSRVFHNEDFRSRNVVAAELEKVVNALIKGSFNRHEFLRSLDPFYKAIEISADQTNTYEEKQTFLNTVYERFFQGYSPKEADTHGIVYTPQPIVDFMVRSVDDILQKEFGKSIADKGVHILDPFVGTGNFIVRVMKQIAQHSKRALAYKYEHELHCNEVMLLPYYIASMNIEHEYLEQMQEYKPFEGICLVDTFELAEPEQATLGFMSEENTARVKKQKESPIFVVVGNPPYNAWQEEENDSNKNRTYPALHRRVWETYAATSRARLHNSLNDPYVGAYRWATDRIGEEGVIALVTNSGYLDGYASDGMRKALASEFDQIYVIDLGGNVRKNPRISGTTHNVFGIQVGVAITLLLRRKGGGRKATINYLHTGEDWTKERRYEFLDKSSLEAGEWQLLKPTAGGDWINNGVEDFDAFMPLGDQGLKRSTSQEVNSICKLFSSGSKTNRDSWTINFNPRSLSKHMRMTIDYYNGEVDRLARERSGLKDIDAFIVNDDQKISWSGDLKDSLKRFARAQFSESKVRNSLYRPFTKEYLFFDRVFNNRVYLLPSIFPNEHAENENVAICSTAVANTKPFHCLAVAAIPDLHLTGDSQCFPFYTYDEDGSNRHENITDWALNEFRTHYSDKSITKWQIFYYTYALLHHPQYRERYAANLKRELPRIPYAPDFKGFAKAGEKLADLHINYEKQPEFALKSIENPEAKPDFRVEKMRLSKDKTTLFYNEFLTFQGIPAETYEYRLGNRSALEWVIDQYQVSTDKRSGITNDPNREDDPEYILRLIGQVIYVSLETMKIVNALPTLGLPLEVAVPSTEAAR